MEVKYGKNQIASAGWGIQHRRPLYQRVQQTGQERKELFLHDARALLKETGGFLTQAGWSKCDIRVNPARVAVSGDVYAKFWKPADPLNIIYCTISASAVAFSGLITCAPTNCELPLTLALADIFSSEEETYRLWNKSQSFGKALAINQRLVRFLQQEGLC